ncbi:insulin-like growth factor-binding protein complex acid labile subunit [Hetaerina americana]|uniref:insulin-like growth factor-binding protein complex acid labile subunit n=1 Tax=Hetaerina americana TaxID=62018 RepID=UPI003A7F2B6C
MAPGRRLAHTAFFILGFSLITTLSTTPKYPLCPYLCLCSGTEHSGILNTSTSVTKINCSGVNLKKFPTDLPSSVKVLDLSFNLIDTLPTPGALAYLVNLETLILRGNSYEGPVRPKEFLGLRALQKIDLSYNTITSLHNESFYGCDQLRIVDLRGNRGLTVIPSFNSSSLKTILLDRCGIVEAGKGPLPSNLTSLYLRGNPMVEMPAIVGQNLHVLDASSCALSFVGSDSLRGMPHLTDLYVSKNARLTSLSDVRSESLRFIYAEDCILGSNEIKGRKGSAVALAPLASMGGLTHAHLAGNRIKVVGPNSFSSNVHLVHLDLSRNGIELITGDSLFRLEKLHAVNLSFNAIKSLDEVTFSKNNFLDTLDLSHNEQLTHLPAFDAISLRRLWASRCEISGIGIKGEGNPLAHMPNLESLDLSRNPLESLPKDLWSQALKNLDLSFCRITVVEPQTLKGLSHLTWLDLRGNRIATLNPDSVRGLKYLALSDNPWKCDCKNPRFQQLWTVLDKMEPLEQPLHCAPYDEDQKLLQARLAPGEGLKRWEEVCSRSSSTVPVPASSMWSLSVAMVLTVAFFMVGGVVLRHWLREKRKLRQEAEGEERSRGQRQEAQRRRVRRREMTSEESDEEEESRGTASRDIVVVRRLRPETQPPSYEEAVLMARPEEVEVRLQVDEGTGGEAEPTATEPGAAGGCELGAETVQPREESPCRGFPPSFHSLNVTQFLGPLPITNGH